MHESNYITENDIFNFVFFRYLLNQDKINIIEKNSIFMENVEFYIHLKEKLSKDISVTVKKKISKKIAQYKFIDKVLLTLVKEESVKKKKDFLVLAADSPKEEPKISTKTFVNEENGYLIKLINLKNSARIFVFSAYEEVLRNYKIILHPSGTSFFQPNNSSPLEINYKIEAENIELEFE
jgi:hypothetical protein